jgi:RHS repeat-associated protein
MRGSGRKTESHKPTWTPTPLQTGLYHYHVDHLGSVQVITREDGSIVQEVRYKPYGEVRYRAGNSTNRYQFTGYQTEEYSGLEYAGARFYDPALGMFLTQARNGGRGHPRHSTQEGRWKTT